MAITLEQCGGGVAVLDNKPAYDAAIASMVPTGGVVEFGEGKYRFCDNLVVPSYVLLKGQGDSNRGTELDFSGATAVAPALTVGAYGNHLRDFIVVGANGPGVQVQGAAYGSIECVDVIGTRSPGMPALRIINTWMYSFENMRVTQATGHGVQVDGYSTSLTFKTVHAKNNANCGFWINDTTYSSLVGCGSDENGDYGYRMQNVNGLTFVSPGAETNGKGMFVAVASNAIAAGATSPDVKGVVINGAFSHVNGASQPYYSALLEAAGFDGRRVDVSLIGPSMLNSPNNIAILMKGSNTKIMRVGGSIIGSASATMGATYNTLV